MACDEAELEPEEFAERMDIQHKLQEQVKFITILVNKLTKLDNAKQ